MANQMSQGKFIPGSIKGRKIVRAGSHANIAAFIKVMLSGPMTKKQISDSTGIYYDTVLSLLKALKRENVIHVCDWLPDSMGRFQTAVYSLGGGEDKERPKKQSGSIRTAAYKKRLKAKNEPIFEPKTKFVGGSLWK